MNTLVLSPELLGTIAGALVSILLAYIPGLDNWFKQLASDWKRLILLVSLVLVTVAIVLLSCNSIIDTGITCDKVGVWQYVNIFVLAIVGNQTTYTLLPSKRK